jgi:hypothetical protein
MMSSTATLISSTASGLPGSAMEFAQAVLDFRTREEPERVDLGES